MDFKIVAVKCNNCGSGLVVEFNDYVTYCTSCGSGYEIVDGDLKPIEINFAAAAIKGEGELVYKPFWLIKTNVNIIERTSTGGFLGNIFGSGSTGSGDMVFYIPAFMCSLDSMKEIASKFTSKNPVASPQKYNVKLTGFAYGKDDAKKLAEFILISFEAEKSDTMKTFQYEINFNSFEVLGIPFYQSKDGRLKDAMLGIEIK
jgi:hypothetical protein